MGCTITSDPTAPPVRALALDLGKRRIGIAATDPSGTLALALEVLTRVSVRSDLDRLLELIDARDVEVLVVGIPVRADGSEGRIARDARFFAAKLADARPSLRVAYHDEAYSTVEAHDRLQQRHMDGRQQRKVVDAVAAQVILEDWLVATQQGR